MCSRPLVLALIAGGMASSCSANGVGQPGPALSARAPSASAAASAESTAPPGEPTAASAAVSLTEDMVAPYFASGPGAEGFALFRAQAWAEARARFEQHLAQAADRVDQARTRLLLAMCDARLSSWARAGEGFAFAARELPLLADYANFHAGRAYLFSGDPAAAERHVRAVGRDSVTYAEAQLLIGDLLLRRRAFAEMVPHYTQYLANRKRGPRLDEATYRLAQALEQTGRRDDALARYRRIPIFAPLSDWSGRAQARMSALTATMPKAEAAKLSRLSAAEYIERGFVYFENQRNPESAAQFEAALSAPGLTDELACVAAFHQAQSWWKERNRTKSAPLFDQASALCAKTDNVDLKVKSAYQAGRSYAMLRERGKAIERYAAAEVFEHSYADDARMRQAEEYSDLGNDAKVVELLSSIPDKYPAGDMKGEATWRLAWRAFKAKDYEQAIRWLNKQIELVPIDLHWYGAGQAQYWIGRANAELGRADASLAAYRECIRVYPLSYYSLLALNRMREHHPEAFAATVAELRQPAADAAELTFAPRPLYASPGFRRGLEFLRLGLGREASLEWARIGLQAPGNREPVTDPDLVDKLWAMAFLFDRAGRYDLSHWPTRWHIVGYQRQWPAGPAAARWRIAYPMAFADLITEAARKHGYPFSLQMAIMREESAFDPHRESWANAIGLTQMIFPTARRFARGTGIAVTRENLRDPVKNVTIGSNFLAYLHTIFEGRVGLMVPSYNAGEGRTWRWLFERHWPQWQWDEWEEEIPGDQARNYTKRVLGSYFVYAYLADGSVPVIPNDLPVRLVPANKARQWAGPQPAPARASRPGKRRARPSKRPPNTRKRR
jgi:soluble lytic murein transglycosylase